MAGPPTARRNQRKRQVTQRELREMTIAGQAAYRTVHAWLVLRNRIRAKLLGGATIEQGRLFVHPDLIESEHPTDAEAKDLLA
jgi:hypothetical protein